VNESEEKEEMVVTPWRVSGAVDYNRLIEQFGTSPITQGIRDRMEKHAGYFHAQLRRRVFFSHRDMDWWLDTYDRGERRLRSRPLLPDDGR
jgi:tryptophanyl-tRNA synthetase